MNQSFNVHQQANDIEFIAQSLQNQAQLLASAASISGTGARNDRDQPVQQILWRCAELVRGAGSLGKGHNAVALGILARAVLENTILLLWVEISDANAREFSEAGDAELARFARINPKNGKLSIKNRHTDQDATEELLASEQFKNLPKRKSVESRAQEAGVADLYNIFYRYLSIDTHGHATGLAMDESASNIAVVHMQGIGACGNAADHAGRRWLLHRERTDNETLRTLLGLHRES